MAHWRRIAPAGAACFLLAGCGGGGGAVDSTGTPPAAPTTNPTTNGATTPPAPAFVPAPQPIAYDDSEYARSNGATAAGAIGAWKAGSIGAGVTIAILDTGLTDTGGEFAGRISSASRSISDSAGFADRDGHGTAVAAIAAAGRNASDIEGLAFGATIMALRTDATGTCGTTDGCSFNTSTLATAVDYAADNGAKVINMSLGGSAAPSQLRAAINRATAKGVVIVIAGGNDGDAEPDPLAQIAGDSIARGLVIIAGSNDSTGALSTFSDKAGGFADHFITALGTRVRSFDNLGTAYYYSGTSFSAPAVAAAIALIEAAFPNLTPAQAVNLLYASATDAGAVGTDAVFGRGQLNLARAFQPLGTTSLAGSAAPVSLAGNAILSGAMGDATMAGAGVARAIVLDGYARAFTVDLAGTVAHVGQRHVLASAIGGATTTRDRQHGPVSVSLTMARDLAGEPWAGFAQRGLTAGGQFQARPVAAIASMTIGATMRAGFGFSSSGRRVGDLIGAGDGSAGAFLVARAPDDGPGFDARSGTAAAVRRTLGRLAIDLSAERGTLSALRGTPTAPTYTMTTIRATRRLGALALGVAAGTLDESRTVLGARFGPALGGGGATTRLAGLDARLVLARGWRLRAAWRRGWTDAAIGGALTRGHLVSQASAFDFGRAGRGARIGVRYAEPLRVTGGGFALSVPTRYDYATGLAILTPTRLDLTPVGRERDVEAYYGMKLAVGWVDTNVYWRGQPGNIALAADDVGAAVRYAAAF